MMFFIWDHGTKFRRKGLPKPDWLCNYCWDKRIIIIENTSTTYRCIKYLEEIHRLNKHNPIIDLKAATFIILDLLMVGAASKDLIIIGVVTQVILRAFHAALVY
jgi:hypothetical protein